MFIVFDGIDGAGKSTQISLLVDWLEGAGHRVTCCKDPGSTALGERLRSILLNEQGMAIHNRTEMMLFSTARTQLVEEIIKPALARNQVVVLDRFVLSTIVYQGHAGNLQPDQIRRVSHFVTDGIQPDLTLVLDLPVETAVNRLGSTLDRMESRGPEYFQKVRQGFLQEAERLGPAAVVIDATQAVEQIHQQVTRHVEQLIAAMANEVE